MTTLWLWSVSATSCILKRLTASRSTSWCSKRKRLGQPLWPHLKYVTRCGWFLISSVDLLSDTHSLAGRFFSRKKIEKSTEILSFAQFNDFNRIQRDTWCPIKTNTSAHFLFHLLSWELDCNRVIMCNAWKTQWRRFALTSKLFLIFLNSVRFGLQFEKIGDDSFN